MDIELRDITYICMDCDTRYKKQFIHSNQALSCPECGSESLAVPFRSVNMRSPGDDVCERCHGTGKEPVRAIGLQLAQTLFELRKKFCDNPLICEPKEVCRTCEFFDREKYDARAKELGIYVDGEDCAQI